MAATVWHGSSVVADSRSHREHRSCDAFHPQTILAYEMNGAPLPVPHGAPLRRLERQLGYKMAKFLARIEVVDRLDAYPTREWRYVGGRRL
jgi:DMSO/TMAO reductase YedYZ molybdopterin-dependent catalytic subunit